MSVSIVFVRVFASVCCVLVFWALNPCAAQALPLAQEAQEGDGERSPWSIRGTFGLNFTEQDDQGILLRKPDHIGNALIGFRSAAVWEVGVAYQLLDTVSLRGSYQTAPIDFGTEFLTATDPLDPSTFTSNSVQLGTGRHEMGKFGVYWSESSEREAGGWIWRTGVVFGPTRFRSVTPSPEAITSLRVVRIRPRAGFVVGWDVEVERRLGRSGWSLGGVLTLTTKGVQPKLDIEVDPASDYEPGVAHARPHIFGVTMGYRLP